MKSLYTGGFYVLKTMLSTKIEKLIDFKNKTLLQEKGNTDDTDLMGFQRF